MEETRHLAFPVAAVGKLGSLGLPTPRVNSLWSSAVEGDVLWRGLAALMTSETLKKPYSGENWLSYSMLGN